MIDEATLKSLLTALGIGLLIGVVRERRRDPDAAEAGIRTHTLISILGAVTWNLGTAPFVTTLVIVGAFAVTSYLKTADQDPGLTGEVSMVLTFILATMAQEKLELASALAVFCAIFIQAKTFLHRVGRELITEQELGDALLLSAAALIIMPLLPDGAMDPWGVLKPTTVWRIVVLIMAIGMLGHVARRALGTRLGLPLAGFFSGFASSTAAIAGLGQKGKHDPGSVSMLSAAALLANLSSLLLFGGVLATVSPELLRSMLVPIGFGCLALGVCAGILLFRQRHKSSDLETTSGRAFKLSQAFLIALLISGVSLLAAWLNQLYGGTGALVANVIAATAELHAAAASLGQLSSTGAIEANVAEWGIIAVLSSSAVAKIFLAYFSGGRKYCLQIAVGLVLMVVGTLCGKVLL